jgi:hypothetical protein
MTSKVREIQQAESASAQAQLAQVLCQLAMAIERIHELEKPVAKDSHNSSKPLASK